MKTKKEFYKMIAERLSGDPNAESITNCHGYSLFVCGEKDRERFVSGKYSTYFDELVKSDKAYFGSIAVWRDKDGVVKHSGIVRNANPIVISNRREVSGKIFNRDTKQSIHNFYQTEYPEFNFSEQELEFRLPSKLKKILDKEARN